MNDQRAIPTGRLAVLHPGVEAADAADIRAARSDGSNPSRRIGLAPRLATLAGKRLALLDNNNVNARELLHAFAERLQRDYGIGEIRAWRKPTSAAPAPFMDEIRQWMPDLLFSASGD